MRGNASRLDDAPPASHDDADPSAPVRPRTEDVHLRNYDVRLGYDLEVRVDGDDGVVFADQYYLQPGDFRSELDVIDPGEYEVAVRLDNGEWESTTCRIGPDPEHTVLVELGNGVVSVTGGVY